MTAYAYTQTYQNIHKYIDPTFAHSAVPSSVPKSLIQFDPRRHQTTQQHAANYSAAVRDQLLYWFLRSHHRTQRDPSSEIFFNLVQNFIVSRHISDTFYCQ